MTHPWHRPQIPVMLCALILSRAGCDRNSTEPRPVAASRSLTYPGGEKNFGITAPLTVALVVEVRDESGDLLTNAPVTFTSRNPASLEVSSTGVMKVKATPGGYVVAETPGRTGVLRDSIKCSVIEILPGR